MKNKHRIKQGLALLLAGGIALTNLGAVMPAFAEDAAATPETAQMATLDPDAAVLYADLPDAPAGSYIGSEGLPVATGQTKIDLSLWADGQLKQDGRLDPDALNSGDKTVTVPLTEDTDYAIVPLMAQVEYPADGSRTDVLLPENVTLLDYYGEPAQDTTVLHSEYAETSAAATGLYLLTDGDFTAQLVYTAPDGNSLTQNLNVVIDRSSTAAPPFADMGVAPYAGRPTPAVTSGRITKVAKVNATWLIWFNGEPAYCCTHGANGQPNGCPPYSYSHTSTVGADQCIPGDHYGNQIRIWGGLNQLSLDEGGDFPAVFCAEDEAELSVSDFCEMIYDDLQLYIMQHYPDSRAAALYRESAEELLNGVQTYTAEAGYYTYIYQPAASGWQTVALIGPAIEGEEPEPEPVPQEYYADWQAPVQTAGGSFDLTFTVNTDKYQLNTLEKVDGAVITVTPSRTSGNVDGGSWQMRPAAAQTITTSGHTQDDSFHLNGGDGSATWTVHYEVSKTSTSTLWFAVDIPIRAETYPDSGNSGRYRIVEVAAPAGYLLDSTPVDVEFTYEGQQIAWQVVDGTNTNLRTTVDISKQDITNGKELPDAKLEIRDADGNLVEGWTSTKTPHTVRGLELEKAYTLTETRAPDGYAEAESIVFKLVQNGTEQVNEVYVKSDDDWVKLDDATVIMQDAPVLDIDKTDIAGNLLPGATLTIRDANDEVVDTWITDYKTHRVPISDQFIKLSDGNKEYIYTLAEDAAPAGFEIALSAAFRHSLTRA